MTQIPPEIQAEIDALIALVTEGLRPSLYLKLTPEQLPKTAANVVRAVVWRREEFRRLRASEPTPVLGHAIVEKK